MANDLNLSFLFIILVNNKYFNVKKLLKDGGKSATNYKYRRWEILNPLCKVSKISLSEKLANSKKLRSLNHILYLPSLVQVFIEQKQLQRISLHHIIYPPIPFCCLRHVTAILIIKHF